METGVYQYCYSLSVVNQETGFCFSSHLTVLPRKKLEVKIKTLFKKVQENAL